MEEQQKSRKDEALMLHEFEAHGIEAEQFDGTAYPEGVHGFTKEGEGGFYLERDAEGLSRDVIEVGDWIVSLGATRWMVEKAIFLAHFPKGGAVPGGPRPLAPLIVGEALHARTAKLIAKWKESPTRQLEWDLFALQTSFLELRKAANAWAEKHTMSNDEKMAIEESVQSGLELLEPSIKPLINDLMAVGHHAKQQFSKALGKEAVKRIEGRA